MKKNYILLLLAGLLVAISLEFNSSKKVYFVGEPVSIVAYFEGKDWREEKSWKFITTIGDEEKFFEVYPGVFEALIYNATVEINLAEIDEQFNGESDRIVFDYLGKTQEDVHIFNILNVTKWISHLLFVQFEKNQGMSLHDLHEDIKSTFYEDQVLIKKVGAIPLGREFYQPIDFILEENILKIGSHVFNLSLKPPAFPELITETLFRFDGKPFINPILVDCFTSCVRTGYTSTIAKDLTEAQKHPAYCFLGNDFRNCTIKDYEYIYLGMTKNGVHFVESLYLGAHPPHREHLFFIFEKDYELRIDWEKKIITRDKERILLKKMGGIDYLCLAAPPIITNNTISYTDMVWNNKPYVILGPIEYINKLVQIELKTFIPNVIQKLAFDKEAAQNFSSGASDHCLWQGTSEDKNFDAKPTQSTTNF